MFRAAIVLLHATVDDSLRNVGRSRLPISEDPCVLNRIPLAGSRSGTEPGWVLLGHLIAHRGKGVQELIRESVEEHLERRPFSGCAQIAGFLSDLGVDTASVKDYLPHLDRLAEWRHRIVHQVDLPAADGSQAPEITVKDVHDIMLSTKVVTAFASRVIEQFLPGEFREEHKRRRDQYESRMMGISNGSANH